MGEAADVSGMWQGRGRMGEARGGVLATGERVDGRAGCRVCVRGSQCDQLRRHVRADVAAAMHQ